MLEITLHLYTLDEAFEKAVLADFKNDKTPRHEEKIKTILILFNSFSSLSGVFVNHFKYDYITEKGFVKCKLKDVYTCLSIYSSSSYDSNNDVFDTRGFDTQGYFYNIHEISDKVTVELDERINRNNSKKKDDK